MRKRDVGVLESRDDHRKAKEYQQKYPRYRIKERYRRIVDPDGTDGRRGEAAGLGLLDVETTMGGDKITVPVRGRHPSSGEAVSGYEIHLGRTHGPDCARPFLDLDGRPDGACSPDGRVMGTYVHGLFASDGFRRAFLAAVPGKSASSAKSRSVSRP